MENKDSQDSPTTSTAPPLSSNISVDPSKSIVAETPVSPSHSTGSLPLGPSSSTTVTPTPTANLLFGSPLSSAASLPLGPLSSTLTPPSTSNLLFGSSLSSAPRSSTVTPTPDVDLSLTLSPLGPDVKLSLDLNLPAAASTSLGQDLSLGSQDASSSRVVPRKKRSIHFPMTRINIGNWTQTAANSRELIAKCYFTRKQFVWEIISEVETDGAGLRKQVKKMEIDWNSVLSFKAEHDCFQIELSKPPRFRTEKNDNQDIRVWKDIDHFAEDHPSSTCRRHSLFFDPQVLKTNIDKIREDAFWSTIKNVQFPSLPSLFFLADDQTLLGPQDNLEAATQAGEKRTFDQIS